MTLTTNAVALTLALLGLAALLGLPLAGPLCAAALALLIAAMAATGETE